MLRLTQAVVVVASLATMAGACPFCTVVAPSLSQRCEEATVAVLAEVSQADTKVLKCRAQKMLHGKLPASGDDFELPTTHVTGAATIKAGQLALLLAVRGAAEDELAWEIVPLDEISYAYVARAPARRLPAAERLRYYVKFLEHRDPLLAEDSYCEFGRAAYDDVARVAASLPFASIRRWIVDQRVPEPRKGFYGLALGLATSPAERAANRDVLRKIIDSPANDFRSGFDGVLGGYLMLTGRDGLALVEERFLANPQAKRGDVQHGVTALRFMHEFGRSAVPPAEVARAMRRLLARTEFAAAAIVDLARMEDWDAQDAVVALFGRAEYPEPATSRAIVGYLLASPRPAASDALATLRKRDPRRVAEAERTQSPFGPNR